MSPLKAWDLETLPTFQGFGLWWLGTYTGVPVSSGWEIAYNPSGTATSSNDASYTLPHECHGRFQKASGTVGSTGGATQHRHVSSSHAHTCYTSPNADTMDDTGTVSDHPRVSHTHIIYNGGGQYLGYGANDPYYLDAIPVVFCSKAAGAGKGLPRLHDLKADCLPPQYLIGWTKESTLPLGWAPCDGGTYNGNVVTPNLNGNGKFLRGIASTGEAPGTLEGGQEAHLHSMSHNHTTPGGEGYSGRERAGNGISSYGHVHSLDTVIVNSSSPDTTVEPLFSTVKFVMFVGLGGNGAAAHTTARLSAPDLDPALLYPRGIVAAKANAGLPTGWGHCDGGAFANGSPSGYSTKPNALGRFLKMVGNNTTSGGGGGGSDTHSHSGDSHTHPIEWIHARDYPPAGDPTYVTGRPFWNESQMDPGHSCTNSDHNHTGTSNGAVNSSVASSSNVPTNIHVAWIVRD